ncbi:hypothetical protein [Anaerosporobacter sp.]
MNDLQVSTAIIVQPERKTKEEVVFNKERDLLRNYMITDKANYYDIAPYAVLLSLQLGLRVGELIALKWSDINYKKNTIHIQRQEVIYDKYNDKMEKVASSVHEVVETKRHKRAIVCYHLHQKHFTF